MVRIVQSGILVVKISNFLVCYPMIVMLGNIYNYLLYMLFLEQYQRDFIGYVVSLAIQQS